MNGMATLPSEIPSQSASGLFDEIALARPEAARVYRAIEQLLLSYPPDRLQRLHAQAQRLMRDLGVSYLLDREQPQTDHIVPFDLFPRVIEAQEWEFLSQGIAQRIKIWNAFLQDIYSHQEVLKADIIPFPIVYNDPAYLRPAVGLYTPDHTFAHIGAFDLARDPSGRWVVTEDYLSTLVGPTYAMQTRHVLSHICPELLDTVDLLHPHNYPAQLLERLQAHQRQISAETRIVMLTSEPDHHAFYEHSFMARQMGIPLVRGNDLTVINSRVFLRTIGGLEPIDVIYRRLDECWLDPLEMRSDTLWGLPGLMNCIRKATVTVVNSVGTSLGSNRAIASLLHRLARFYFNETLILPTVPRLLCSDPDQCDLALAQLPSSRVLPLSARLDFSRPLTFPSNDQEIEESRNRILAQPDQFVTEPLLPLSLLPVLGPGGLEKRHAGLRLFAWGNPDAQVPALALTRYALPPLSRTISSGLGGGIKDTWVLGQPGAPEKAAPIQVFSPPRRLRLASRIADSLYWMSRYKCRAENTTRILRVLQQLQIEDHYQQNPRSWEALWEALARATGHATHFFKRSARFRRQTVSHYVLLDPSNPSSVLNSIGHCRHNAKLCRESVPPELWVIINRLYQRLQTSSQAEPWNEQTDISQVQELEEDILNQLDALSGSAAKNMLRDDGWHFWTMGVCIERALNTLLVTRQVLMKRQNAPSDSPRRDESNLDALLRMLACQYAYRSLFQTRPLFPKVAAMVLQDPQLPRSVLFCLQSVRHALEAVFGAHFNPLEPLEEASPLRLCAQLISEIEFADLNPYFSEDNSGKIGRLRQWLDQVADRLVDLATLISDHYLYHQNFRVLR